MFSGFKKGQLGISILFIVIVALISLLVYGMVNVASFAIFDEFHAEVVAGGELTGEGLTVLDDMHTRMPKNLDSTVVLIMGLLLVIVSFIAWSSTDSTMMIIILIFVMIFLIIVGSLLSNAWDEYSESGEYSTAIESFPITNWVLSNFLLIVLGMASTSLLIIGLRGRLT